MSRLNYAAVAPEGIKALYNLSTYAVKSTIDASLKHLIDLRVSQINGCAYCMNMHSEEARSAGETQQRLDILPGWHETSFFTDRERAALAWAESVTLVSETHVPDDVFAAVKEHFSEREIVDLTLIIATINAWNRLAITFRSEPEVRKAG